MKLPGPSETQIHASIVEYCLRCLPHDAVVHHSVNEGKRGFAAQRWLKHSGAQAGWPDLEIFYRQQVAFLEVKSGTGRVSPQQQALHDRLRDAGFYVWVVRSLEEAQKVLALFAKAARDAA